MSSDFRYFPTVAAAATCSVNLCDRSHVVAAHAKVTCAQIFSDTAGSGVSYFSRHICVLDVRAPVHMMFARVDPVGKSNATQAPEKACFIAELMGRTCRVLVPNVT